MPARSKSQGFAQGRIAHDPIAKIERSTGKATKLSRNLSETLQTCRADVALLEIVALFCCAPFSDGCL